MNTPVQQEVERTRTSEADGKSSVTDQQATLTKERGGDLWDVYQTTTPKYGGPRHYALIRASSEADAIAKAQEVFKRQVRSMLWPGERMPKYEVLSEYAKLHKSNQGGE